MTTEQQTAQSNEQAQAYRDLGPDLILNTLDAVGYRCDARLLALNSYENRVYQIGIEDGDAVVAKFYRPARWSDAAIEEEHRFTLELADGELPVIAPLVNETGTSLYHQGPYRFAVYPCRGGRAPELDNPDHLEQLGRFLARIHLVGETGVFAARPHLSIDEFGIQAREFLLQQDFIPADLRVAYESLTQDLLQKAQVCFDRAGDVQTLRLHGDCHPGNILWRDDVPLIVDFDDARTGPAIQDLWMFLSGDREYMSARLEDVLRGYSQFRTFDPRELHLIEALRTLRVMHYAAWLARRWDDPAFPRAFPYFNTQRYWEDHILGLREQAALMDEAPLEWHP